MYFMDNKFLALGNVVAMLLCKNIIVVFSSFVPKPVGFARC